MQSESYLKYWHSRYNNLIFAGKLLVPRIYFKSMTDMGECWGSEIYISDCLTSKDIRATMLHEMIHQWQYENKLPMDHGRSFKQWEDTCLLLTGLRP